jgi:CheY-like chemotaxis protein
MGDSIRLSQTVRNLVSNALKFSPHDTTIVIRAQWEEHGLPSAPALKPKVPVPSAFSLVGDQPQRMGSLILSVVDEGPGISKDDQKRLFGEGQQFNANALQNGQGSGLGLFIAKGIVDLHGGRIWAVSENVGARTGSTFYVELPMVVGIPDAVGNETSTSGLHTGAGVSAAVSSSFIPIPISVNHVPLSLSPDLRSNSMPANKLLSKSNDVLPPKLAQHKILVVDDSAPNRKLLCRLLTNRGYECEIAENGQKCVEKILSSNSSDYSCVLLDNQMPVVSNPPSLFVLPCPVLSYPALYC